MVRGVTDDPYRVLQVDPSAEAEVIEAAYRRLVRKYHPDVNPAPEAAVRMRQLVEAYAVLRDPERRADLDRRRTSPLERWRAWRRDVAARQVRPGRAQARPEIRQEPVGGLEDRRHDRMPCAVHRSRLAVGACRVCGGSLCSACAALVHPAGCPPCVRRRARRTQVRSAVAIGGFATAFGLVLTIALGSVRAGPGAGLVSAYLVSSTVLGIAVMAGRLWRTGWQDEPRGMDLGVAFLVWAGVLIGWIGTPLLLVKMARDLGRGRRLEQSAGALMEASEAA